MKIRSIPPGQKTTHKELLVAFASTGKNPNLGASMQTFVKKAKATGDLSTDNRAVSLFRPDGRGAAKRVLFVGMGKRSDVDAERLRRAAAVAQKRAAGIKVKGFRLLVNSDDHQGLAADVAARSIVEGLILASYKYAKPSGTKPKPPHANQVELQYVGPDQKGFKAGVQLGRIGSEATVFARDIENAAGNIATPTYLAKEARKFKKPGLTVKILEERDMARLKMGSLLGVSRGSKEPAKLIVMDYKPTDYKKTVCVVGKGLTFDTGGISLKPGGKMDEMRYDMCGGGAVLGLFHAISNGGMKGVRGKVRIVGIVPSSENMPGSEAQKPGDVVTACDGTTIEVLNTDAEGRLILADALAYAKKTYKPAQMVDLATLTGAVIVALGHEMSGIMGTDDALIDDLIEAGRSTRGSSPTSHCGNSPCGMCTGSR